MSIEVDLPYLQDFADRTFYTSKVSIEEELEIKNQDVASSFYTSKVSIEAYRPPTYWYFPPLSIPLRWVLKPKAGPTFPTLPTFYTSKVSIEDKSKSKRRNRGYTFYTSKVSIEV